MIAATVVVLVMAAPASDPVRPFLDAYCVSCHGGEKPKGQLSLTGPRDVEQAASVLEKLVSGDMPPAKARQPGAGERKQAIASLNALRLAEARQGAGDPGVVLARRLSNAEYNYTIRDLTGQDIRPTREFPVDPANPAGFDNSGESLIMSPALMIKYLQAAREVASHLVLQPQGLSFAPHPMLVDTDRDRYCVNRIVEFYQRQPTDLADYFLAAWRYGHRAGKPGARLADFAKDLSAKYLTTVWTWLQARDSGAGADLRAAWKALPSDEAAARAGSERLRDQVLALRKTLEPRFDALSVPGLGATAQPFLMWKNRQYAGHRLTCDKAEASAFCAAFPDAFYVAERGRNYLDPTKDKGRYLSAGFHNLMGYFRDDQPLYQLVLDQAGQRELDALWADLDFVADGTLRTYVQFYLSESGEGRKAASEADAREITSSAAIARMKALYLEKARPSGNQVAASAIDEHFRSIDSTLRWLEKARAEAEPHHLQALQDFAARAYRRPLTSAEKADLLGYYHQLRDKGGLDHDAALRDALVSVLMSPDFCYRIDLAPTGRGVHPLSDHALASRLSYFLWSSLPDAELLAHAQAGDLHRPAVLAAQVRRMIKDDRVRALATEFGGNWLDFRRFEEHNAVDRERFPTFDDQLRSAMFEEPVRFLVDAFQRDRSVLDLLYADHTFVNAALARHYGVETKVLGWQRLDQAGRYGRGGILPMAAFLTKNAPGLRTSPVKRGYWVVKNVLGERIPPPPAVVPELPRDEAKMDLPLREALARHRQDPACAGCHARFDALGLVFEGYGPVGEVRTKDLAGHPVDPQAQFPRGGEGTGLIGLREYLKAHRQDDFLDNVSRKVLAYGLGRSLVLSDELLVNKMRAGGLRWSRLIETLVSSPQFLNKRGRDVVAASEEVKR